MGIGVGRLRGFTVQQNRGACWISLDQESCDFLGWLKSQVDLGSNAFSDLDVLLDRLIVVQSGRELMGPKGHMSKSVRRLRRFTVQKNGGAWRISLNRKGGDFLDRFEFQTDLGSHAFSDLNVLLDLLIVVQSGRELVGPER